MDKMIRCFDVVSTVVDAKTDRCSENFVLNSEKYDILHEYCDAIEKMMSESSCTGIEADIDENMHVVINVECDELIVEGKPNLYGELADRAISVDFSIKEGSDDEMFFSFTFPSVWDPVK